VPARYGTADLSDLLANLRRTATTKSLLSDLARVSYRTYGDAGQAQDLVLIHGGGANARWWDHLAPSLARERRVVAVDLSGHGRSDWRDSYSYDQWAKEVIDVSCEEDLSAPLVVGHSMGGKVALRVAELFGAHLSGILVLDTPMRQRTPTEQARLDRLSRSRRLYETRRDAIANFRIAPPANDPPQALVDHLARESVVQDGAKWRWRFDPGIYARDGAVSLATQPVTCPVTIVRAEHGALDAESARRVASAMGDVEIIELAGVGHHMILDDPCGSLSLITEVARRRSNIEEGEWDR
jgi:pimeloyl-ACP methyl ester carboxylesterase